MLNKMAMLLLLLLIAQAMTAVKVAASEGVVPVELVASEAASEMISKSEQPQAYDQSIEEEVLASLKVHGLQPELARQSDDGGEDEAAQSYHRQQWAPQHMGGGTNIVPLVAVILIFSSPVLMIWILGRSRVRRAQIQQQCLQQLLAADREIPESLFSSLVESPDQRMRSGLKLLGVGMGLLLFLTTLTGFEVGSIGFIPVCIGLAQIAIWRFERGRRV